MKRSVIVDVSTDPDVPKALYSHSLRLRQILINVIGNVVKFTSQGRVAVRARMERGLVVVEVADTGRGIPPARIGQMFQVLDQRDVLASREGGGAGLGLILSRDLTRALGGNLVLASSVVGQGSVFAVALDPSWTGPGGSTPLGAGAPQEPRWTAPIT